MAKQLHCPIWSTKLQGEDDDQYWILESQNEMHVLVTAFQITVLKMLLRKFHRCYSGEELFPETEFDMFRIQLKYQRSDPFYYANGCGELLWQIPIHGQLIPDHAQDPEGDRYLLESLFCDMNPIETFLVCGKPEMVEQTLSNIETEHSRGSENPFGYDDLFE